MIPPLAQKLIPRLASSHDGEVAATARAFVRVLKADGFDLHDLARMANAAPVLRDRDLAESEYARRVRAMLKEILIEGWLDTWSAEFAESILERRNLDELSAKQTGCLNKILRRAKARQPKIARRNARQACRPGHPAGRIINSENRTQINEFRRFTI